MLKVLELILGRHQASFITYVPTTFYSYDASYLELALRSGLPLATLDEDLKRAAKKAGVEHFKAA